jgi:hypothetical protein
MSFAVASKVSRSSVLYFGSNICRVKWNITLRKWVPKLYFCFVSRSNCPSSSLNRYDQNIPFCESLRISRSVSNGGATSAQLCSAVIKHSNDCLMFRFEPCDCTLDQFHIDLQQSRADLGFPLVSSFANRCIVFYISRIYNGASLHTVKLGGLGAGL